MLASHLSANLQVQEAEIETFVEDSVAEHELVLVNKELIGDTALFFADAIQSAFLRGLGPAYETINISACKLDVPGFTSIVEALARCLDSEDTKLRKLVLRNNQFVHKEYGSLIAKLILEANGSLQEVDLSDSNLGTGGAHALVSATFMSSAMETISMPALFSIYQLQVLDLSGNNIGDMGILSICKGMASLVRRHQPINIQILRLNRNNITDHGAQCITQQLMLMITQSVSQATTKVYDHFGLTPGSPRHRMMLSGTSSASMYMSPLSPSTPNSLLGTSIHYMNLQELCLDDNNIAVTGMHSLLSILPSYTSLQVLSLSRCQPNFTILEILASTLASGSTSITCIDIKFTERVAADTLREVKKMQEQSRVSMTYDKIGFEQPWTGLMKRLVDGARRRMNPTQTLLNRYDGPDGDTENNRVNLRINLGSLPAAMYQQVWNPASGKNNQDKDKLNEKIDIINALDLMYSLNEVFHLSASIQNWILSGHQFPSSTDISLSNAAEDDEVSESLSRKLFYLDTNKDKFSTPVKSSPKPTPKPRLSFDTDEGELLIGGLPITQTNFARLSTDSTKSQVLKPLLALQETPVSKSSLATSPVSIPRDSSKRNSFDRQQMNALSETKAHDNGSNDHAHDNNTYDLEKNNLHFTFDVNAATDKAPEPPVLKSAASKESANAPKRSVSNYKHEGASSAGLDALLLSPTTRLAQSAIARLPHAAPSSSESVTDLSAVSALRVAATIASVSNRISANKSKELEIITGQMPPDISASIPYSTQVNKLSSVTLSEHSVAPSHTASLDSGHNESIKQQSVSTYARSDMSGLSHGSMSTVTTGHESIDKQVQELERIRQEKLATMKKLAEVADSIVKDQSISRQSPSSTLSSLPRAASATSLAASSSSSVLQDLLNERMPSNGSALSLSDLNRESPRVGVGGGSFLDLDGGLVVSEAALSRVVRSAVSEELEKAVLPQIREISSSRQSPVNATLPMDETTSQLTFSKASGKGKSLVDILLSNVSPRSEELARIRNQAQSIGLPSATYTKPPTPRAPTTSVMSPLASMMQEIDIGAYSNPNSSFSAKPINARAPWNSSQAFDLDIPVIPHTDKPTKPTDYQSSIQSPTSSSDHNSDQKIMALVEQFQFLKSKIAEVEKQIAAEQIACGIQTISNDADISQQSLALSVLASEREELQLAVGHIEAQLEQIIAEEEAHGAAQRLRQKQRAELRQQLSSQNSPRFASARALENTPAAPQSIPRTPQSKSAVKASLGSPLYEALTALVSQTANAKQPQDLSSPKRGLNSSEAKDGNNQGSPESIEALRSRMRSLEIALEAEHSSTIQVLEMLLTQSQTKSGENSSVNANVGSTYSTVKKSKPIQDASPIRAPIISPPSSASSNKTRNHPSTNAQDSPSPLSPPRPSSYPVHNPFQSPTRRAQAQSASPSSEKLSASDADIIHLTTALAKDNLAYSELKAMRNRTTPKGTDRASERPSALAFKGGVTSRAALVLPMPHILPPPPLSKKRS